ncbi:cupin domain-containing protein [Alteromonas halophila]|uniref:DUF985 domain-containing protein n=1 Tax=Alteromonas halophila TaxID=516698 RepID=A0A918JJA1_9ALTE|nr:cupin domain-containing protein [Alteromonas halophila]GGW83809.1 hypothetical protein GCM10007391_16760 [Alteromonas halophila]
MAWKSPHPLIDTLNLTPHPEGGFYREIYQSPQQVTSPAHGQVRQAVTHIYYLLLAGQISRFHRCIHDEIWNHYAGAPLRLYDLHQQQLTETHIGSTTGAFAHVVPGGHFQAAESTGDYSLVGCTVAPGFDFADFSFIDEPCLAEWIKVAHPDMARFL